MFIPVNTYVITGAISSPPPLYNLFSADQPICSITSVAEFANDKVIYITHADPAIACSNLQNHLNDMST